MMSKFRGFYGTAFSGVREWPTKRTEDLVDRAAGNGVKGVTSGEPTSVVNNRFTKSALNWTDATSGAARVHSRFVNMAGPEVARNPRNAVPSNWPYDIDLPAGCSVRTAPARAPYDTGLAFAVGDPSSLNSTYPWFDYRKVSRYPCSVMSMDHRCEDAPFPGFACCVTNSNRDSLSSNEAGDPCNKKLKNKKLNVKKQHGGIYLTKK
jgi:hypothetical protein